ncbi:TetR/AcrR family transcriptional regulator [Pseudomonas sp. NBRC 100443]|uniref:TetR/AcrR family transcriptional regulator n=1 Tax=Pseudomonas sp. NBRC 100443 TaxID=1113665 RepID=UPI002554026A|nr:TetR/AcrR family transcriptional regulator [Pseudomonas sp. NBRC 100443]
MTEKKATTRKKSAPAVKESAKPAAPRTVKAAAPAAKPARRARSSGPEQSINRILESTLDAISRQGLTHLSMSDIGRISGVARGTLYRYFPTKEAVLEGIAQRVRQRFVEGLEGVCEDGQAPYERLSAVLNFLADYSREAKGDHMMKVEPLFVLEFLARQLPYYSEQVSKALKPLFAEVRQQTGQTIDPLIWSNLLLRVNISIFLLPPPDDSAENFKALLASTAFAMLGVTPPQKPKKRARASK